jgi:hypothetical protein
LVTYPLNINDYGKEKKQERITAVQVLRGGNIFEYMVETYINGNISSLKELYQELNKDARKDFIGFLFFEVNPQYLIEMLKATI